MGCVARMGEALLPLVATVCLVGLSVVAWDVSLHALILGTAVTVVTLRLGYRWRDIEGLC